MNIIENSHLLTTPFDREGESRICKCLIVQLGATRSVIPMQTGIHRSLASVIDSHLRGNDADSCKSGMLPRHFHYFESLLTIADEDNAIASIPSDFRYAMSVNLGFHGGTFHPEFLSGRCPSSAV